MGNEMQGKIIQSFTSNDISRSSKVCGICYPVCVMMDIKEPLLLIGKRRLCGGSDFPLSLSKWTSTILTSERATRGGGGGVCVCVCVWGGGVTCHQAVIRNKLILTSTCVNLYCFSKDIDILI